ncbi:GNAT family N-acetyltransferase [Cellulomonas humilata]|uniref:Lysine N-acyltransferase MbtK n=1 Tax=Cellulomonas humilata TaxID=144055 RepID=A0ABU0EJH1_9CELL|nr:GNAT family N-acetyltransferase [Cellulomonas humilata]MDQ0375435.1 penicillin amidase [Cellulomonas humilata]
MSVTLAAGARGAVVDERFVDGLGLLATCVLDPDADLDTIHAWVTAPGTRFWGLAELSREELRDTYAFVDSLPTHHAYLLRCGGEPVALLQVYDPADDPLGECYDVQPGDVGIHLLVGARVRPGSSARLFGALVAFLRDLPGARRIVAEPDVRNDRALTRMTRTGFVAGPVIELPHKRAQLAFLTLSPSLESR